VLESVYEYSDHQFIVEMCVHLKNSAQAPYMLACGSEGTLIWERNRIVITAEPVDKDVQVYGTYAWPKEMRDEYFRSRGVDPANPRAGMNRNRPEPREIKVEPGPSHTDYFLESVRFGKPSRENPREGHAAAGAAHIANISYREGRKVKWDFSTNQIS